MRRFVLASTCLFIAVVVHVAAAEQDWLVDAKPFVACLMKSADGRELVLENGLARRVLRLEPAVATVALDAMATNTRLLRATEPEATLVVDGRRVAVGGLLGQPDRAFLRPEWLDAMKGDPAAFRCVAVEPTTTVARFPWKRVGHAEEPERPWPPPGVGVVLRFEPPLAADGAPDPALAKLVVEVHYELYDGIPLFAKWLVVTNGGTQPRRIDSFVAEELAVVEAESRVEDSPHWALPNLTVVTDMAFGGMSTTSSNPCVQWRDEPDYATQVNYDLKTPCRLVVAPPIGPGVVLDPGSSLVTMRTFELLHDSGDRERQGLATRRMWRTLAPWVTENPLLLHLTSVDPAVAKAALDQAADVGFELVILSFGSGLNMEDDSAANVAKFKALADYAHAKSLRLGGYSLLASRRIDDANDCINPKTGKCGGMTFGDSPCLGSRWGRDYFAKLTHFLDATGFDALEHDGSYPGDVCASTSHPGHRGLDDSQWNQFAAIEFFYRRCRARGVYLNVPDSYFLEGSSKIAMGYRETNWSLPRADQHIHARQHLFDGTWEKTPSMGWMFVPLVQYQGGGAAATIEPLHEHQEDYRTALTNCLAFGAQACYRGPRLYDDEATRELVKERVAWFKRHRAILESDVVHLRRADGQDWDGVVHVDPALEERALAVVWNPLDHEIERRIELPLHYAGLGADRTVALTVDDGATTRAGLDAQERTLVTLTIPAKGWRTVVIAR